MSKAEKPAEPRPLTPVELELMHIVWRLQEASVADVLAALPKERTLAYTSVSTVMRILEQKDVLKSRKVGRGHVYAPRFTREAYEAQSVKHLMETVFDGEPSALVARLVEAVPLAPEELEQIRRLLGKKEKKS